MLAIIRQRPTEYMNLLSRRMIFMVTGIDALMFPDGNIPRHIDALRGKPISRSDLNLAICDVLAR